MMIRQRDSSLALTASTTGRTLLVTALTTLLVAACE